MELTIELFNKNYVSIKVIRCESNKFNFMKLLNDSNLINSIDIDYTIKMIQNRYKHLQIKKILLVEDEPTSNLKYYRRISQMGHYVESYDNAEEAYQRVNDLPYFFDILITDNRLPNMSGADLAKKIKLIHFGIETHVMSADLESIHNIYNFSSKNEQFVNSAVKKFQDGAVGHVDLMINDAIKTRNIS